MIGPTADKTLSPNPGPTVLASVGVFQSHVGYIGDYIGEHDRVVLGDTWSLDYSSYRISVHYSVATRVRNFKMLERWFRV